MENQLKTYAVKAVDGTSELEMHLNEMASNGYELEQVVGYDPGGPGASVAFAVVMKTRQ